MKLHSITVAGLSDAGHFEGHLRFDGNNAIVSGSNGIGKSLFTTAIAWCMGLEPVLGVGHSNVAVLPEAARSRLILNGVEARVLESRARLVISSPQGKRLTITRSIVGDDPDLAHVSFADEDGNRIQRMLHVARHKLADSTGGLHAFLHRWASIPNARVMNRSGSETPIYLENLAALFFIEQVNGWTDIQSLQLRRYGQLEIDAACVEHVLGMRATLTARLQRQNARVVRQQILADARRLSEQADQVCRILLSGHHIPTRRGLDDMAVAFTTLDIEKLVDGKRSETVRSERARLKKKVKNLQRRLNRLGAKPERKDASAEVSAAVIELKSLLNEKRRELRVLRKQLMSQRRAVEEVDAQIQATKDLMRLRSANIGIPTRVDCPTCHQPLSPQSYDLQLSDERDIDQLSQSLGYERTALRRSIRDLEASIGDQLSFIGETQAKLQARKRELRLMTRAASEFSEAAVSIVSDVLRHERRITLLSRFLRASQEVNEAIGAWSDRYRSFVAATTEADEVRSEQSRVELFRKTLFGLLKELRHSAFNERVGRSSFTLDDEYRPMLNDRLLRATGSASDRARMVFAYVLALHQLSPRGEGGHPGFVILDEPLQQNPDERHRESFVNMIGKLWGAFAPQIVILTSLRDDELTQLEQAGISFQSRGSEHVLRLVDSAVNQ